MANVPLRSIQFPGLADKYTVPKVDAALSIAGDAADAKATGDALASKADAVTVDAKAETIDVAALAVAIDNLQRRVSALEAAV